MLGRCHPHFGGITDATLEALAARAGYRIETRWADARGWFTDF
ncbi:MAG TPA: hypothetical protein VNN25_26945 [Thermoanaerobaculia bacterium]|nr:hypothetical protein [Thermoanaerobaculia bacterium]